MTNRTTRRALGPLSVLAACGVLTACAMPPEGVDEQMLVNFDAAVASIGCDMVAESDFIPVELQTGLSRAQVQEVIGYKLASDQGVQLSNGGYRSKVGSCAATAAPAEPAPAA